MRAVWLGEALLRAGRDKKLIKASRSIISPEVLLVRGLIKSSREAVAEGPIVPLHTQLLARAYVLALAQLDTGITGEDLHALARVYLARDAARDAARLARGAIAADDDESGAAAITLSIACERLELDVEANAAAQLAIDHGFTLGYGRLAQLGQSGIAESVALRERVLDTDVARYHGVIVSAGKAVREVGSKQAQRAQALRSPKPGATP